MRAHLVAAAIGEEPAVWRQPSAVTVKYFGPLHRATYSESCANKTRTHS